MTTYINLSSKIGQLIKRTTFYSNLIQNQFNLGYVIFKLTFPRFDYRDASLIYCNLSLVMDLQAFPYCRKQCFKKRKKNYFKRHYRRTNDQTTYTCIVASLLHILHHCFSGNIVQILFVCNNDCANIGLDLKVYIYQLIVQNMDKHFHKQDSVYKLEMSKIN